MRLHSLRLTAIGPFASEQVISFDDLTRGGLFLLEGPTGAGKSTILDAITFGLYGGIASDESSESRLHSDFANPQTQPRVELEFQASGTRYRIIRTPAYDRPKKRGEGTTQEKSSVVLMRRAGGAWDPLSTNAKEVAQLVIQAVGLNRAQFTQVVLLPQGEFARFLRSQDDARRNLLADIFGTEVFERITASLKQRATVLRGTVTEAEKLVGNRLHALAEAGGVSPEQTEDWNARLRPWAPEQLVLLSAEITEYGAGLRLRLGSAVSAAATKAQRQGQAQAAVDRQVDLQTRLGERQDLVVQQRQHQASLAEQDVRHRRRTAGTKAASVAPLQEQTDALAATVKERLTQARDLAGGTAELAEIKDQAQPIAQKADAANVRASRIEHLVVVETELQGRLAHNRKQEAALTELRESLAQLAAKAAEIPDQIRDAQSEESELRAKTADTQLLESDVQTWQRRQTAARSAVQLEAEAAQARDRHRSTIDEYQQAVATHQELVEARFADMAAELARSLQDQTPCLVCGALDHPAPATSKSEPVDQDAIERASEQRAAAESRRDTAKEEMLVVERRLDLALSQSEGHSAAVAQQKHAEVTTQLAETRAAGVQLNAVLGHLTDLAGEQERLQIAVNELTVQIAKAEAALIAAQGHVDADRKRLADAAGDFSSVADHVNALQAESQRLRTLAEALGALAEAESGLAQAAQRTEREATKQGFASAAAARSAWLSEQDLATLTGKITDYESKGHSIHERLNEPRLQNLARLDPNEVAADLQRQRELLGSTTAEAESTAKEKGVLEVQVERFAACLADWERAVAQREDIGTEAAPLLELDVLARGQQGERHMTLTTYVLRYWFEQVVIAANVRLRKIAGGKYQLLRTEEAARKDARVGLGLEVLDIHTGQQRPTASLSGGETFYCSIALALGLADVVQAEAGGASLDTLFIDEGFGTMDGETLNDVMAVIDELRGNQRVVGIVSHVTELKDRISERLEVRRITESGPSQVKVVA